MPIAVDCSGNRRANLADGAEFADVQELKRVLLNHEEQLAEELVESFLAYALGRQLTPADRPHIDQILDQAGQTGHGLRDIIRLVVLSPPFRAL